MQNPNIGHVHVFYNRPNPHAQTLFHEFVVPLYLKSNFEHQRFFLFLFQHYQLLSFYQNPPVNLNSYVSPQLLPAVKTNEGLSLFFP